MHLFYPDVCASCSKVLLSNENVICRICDTELPYTDLFQNNQLVKRFWGRVGIENAASLLYFKQSSPTQNLLHLLKYKGRKDIGRFLGQKLGMAIVNSRSEIGQVDIIVPIPLHWKKQKKRGYNQCDSIAEGLSETIRVPVNKNAVKRVLENVSQTRKSKYERWNNVEHIFRVTKPEPLLGKRILLIDDVVTTGATSEACMKEVLKIQGVKVYFCSIATA